MNKQASMNFQPGHLSEAAMAASRQMWLASLGAAVVTRDWVQNEAGTVLKTLVKEGTAVESRAIRFVGDQIETSMTRANTVWRHTRRTVESTVKQAAETAVSFAQQVLPKSLPKIELPGLAPKAKAPAARAKRTAKKAVRTGKAKVAKVARKAKRAVKAATPRA
jgi:pyruvate/2-oxoglutarate dehydrogenase complex dihydrolipoamide acyltransferase (E2) component